MITSMSSVVESTLMRPSRLKLQYILLTRNFIGLLVSILIMMNGLLVNVTLLECLNLSIIAVRLTISEVVL